MWQVPSHYHGTSDGFPDMVVLSISRWTLKYGGLLMLLIHASSTSLQNMELLFTVSDKSSLYELIKFRISPNRHFRHSIRILLPLFLIRFFTNLYHLLHSFLRCHWSLSQCKGIISHHKIVIISYRCWVREDWLPALLSNGAEYHVISFVPDMLLAHLCMIFQNQVAFKHEPPAKLPNRLPSYSMFSIAKVKIEKQWF